MFKRLSIFIGVVAVILVFIFVLKNQSSPNDETVVTQDLGALRVAVHYMVPGMGYQPYADQELTGLEIDLARLLAEKLYGDQKLVDLQPTTMKSALVMLAKKEVDCVIATQPLTEEKSNAYTYTDGYYTDDINFVYVNGDYTEPSQFAGKKIGVLSKSYEATVLKEVVKETKIEIETVEYESYPDAKEALDRGKIDGFVGAKVQMSSMDSYKRLRIGTCEYGIVVRKANAALGEKLQTALTELRQEGKIGELLNRWQ